MLPRPGAADLLKMAQQALQDHVLGKVEGEAKFAALMAGRAIAQTWRPWWSVAAYMLVLGAVIRFFHFALFGGTLLSLHFYAVDTGIALLFGMAGFRVTRARQMARQYGVLGHRP